MVKVWEAGRQAGRWYTGSNKYPGDLVKVDGAEVTMYLLKMNTASWHLVNPVLYYIQVKHLGVEEWTKLWHDIITHFKHLPLQRNLEKNGHYRSEFIGGIYVRSFGYIKASYIRIGKIHLRNNDEHPNRSRQSA